MTGLLLEPIIKYHKLTNSEKAADSIFRALDWIIKEGLVSSKEVLMYLTADNYKDSGGDPDVNMLVVHGFGYGYRLSGYQRNDYLDIGQKLFDRAVKDAYLERRKHFNQNYRTSGHYLAYIKDGLIIQAQQRQAKQKDPQPVILKDILFFEGFDGPRQEFQSFGTIEISQDKDRVYLNGNSLKIVYRSTDAAGTAGLSIDPWPLEQYPMLSFSYNIPSGAPVGLKVQTKFDDWICLGGTVSYRCSGVEIPQAEPLIDDGQWHEVSFNIKQMVQGKLPGVDQLTAIQFFLNDDTRGTGQFWIDDFKIRH